MTRSPSSTPPLPPDDICGYAVVRALSSRTFLAIADGGRHVVLKPLDPDCLLHGQLHPSIKERLARVRELAVKSTANLHGVERDTSAHGGVIGGVHGGVYLVWEFIGGEPLDSHAQKLSSPALLGLIREVLLSVEALHQVGIVHGALHAQNVIVDPTGRPCLTHVSPLLFQDPQGDELAMRSMIAGLIQSRTDIDASLRFALQKPASLGELAGSLISSGTDTKIVSAMDAQDRRRRNRMIILALCVLVLGLMAALIIAILAGKTPGIA